MALRGLAVFPGTLIHFDVGRRSSIQALDEAMSSGQNVFLVAQRDMAVEEPREGDLFTVGTISSVRQILRLPGDNVRVMVEGVGRGRLLRLTKSEPFLLAEVEPIPAEAAVHQPSARTEAQIRQTCDLFEHYVELAPKMTPDLLLPVLSSEDPGYIADYIAQNLPMRLGDKQAVLEELRPVRRLSRLHHILRREVEILELEQEMQGQGPGPDHPQPAGLCAPGAAQGAPAGAGRGSGAGRSGAGRLPPENCARSAARRGAGKAGEGGPPAGEAALWFRRGRCHPQLSGHCAGTALGQADQGSAGCGGSP